MTTGNVRAFARFAACAVSLSASGALAQQAAEPAQELPPLEVTAKKAAKKAPAKKSQTKAAPKAAPQPVAAPQNEQRPTGVSNGLPAVQDYVATEAATGTKTDTPLRETPQSISVVGKEQIRDQGAQSLQESVRYVPGVFADPYGPDSRGDSTIIRGLAGSYFIDGLRTTYGYSQSTAPIEPYAFERLEVLRGPSSMLYGQAPTGGIINAESKLPSEIPYREIGVEYGSFDFKQVRLDMTGPLTEDGKWLYRIVGLGRDADTQVDFVENDRLMLAPSLTYRPTNNTSLTLMGNFRDDQSGSTQQFYPAMGTLTPNDFGHRVSTSTYGGEPGDYYDTEQQSATFLADHKFNPDLSIHHVSRYTHTENAYDSTYAAVLSPSRLFAINGALVGLLNTYGFGLPDGTEIIDSANAPFLNDQQTDVARSRTIAFQQTDVFNTDTHLTGKFSTGPVHHKVTGGADYMRYERDMQRPEDPVLIDNLLTPNSLTPTGLGVLSFLEANGISLWQSPFNIYNPLYGQSDVLIGFGGITSANNITLASEPPEEQTQTGIYIQDQLAFGPWRAILGLRHDWVRSEGYPDDPSTPRPDGFPDESHEKTTGRAALMYNFDFGLTPYVSYATSFSPLPGSPVGDHMYASVAGDPTRPAAPLEGEQIEVGFKYQPNGAPFMLNASLYEIKEKNQIVQPDFLFDAVQGAEVKVRGFEIEAVGKITPELKIIGSYSYTDAVYEKYPELYAFDSGISDYMKGKRLDGIPEHLASLWAIYSVRDGTFKGLSFGGGVRYVGSSESFGREVDVTTIPNVPIPGQELHIKTPSYTLFDAMVAYETEDWRWQLTGQNLEDKFHVTSCAAYRGDCFLGQARTIITSFTYKF